MVKLLKRQFMYYRVVQIYWYFCVDEFIYNDNNHFTQYQHMCFAVIFCVNMPFFLSGACVAIALDLLTILFGITLMLCLSIVSGYDFFDSHTHNIKIHMLRKYTAWFNGFKRNVWNSYNSAFYVGDNAVFFRTIHIKRAFYWTYLFPKV
jgi:hypothetical protein